MCWCNLCLCNIIVNVCVCVYVCHFVHVCLNDAVGVCVCDLHGNNPGRALKVSLPKRWDPFYSSSVHPAFISQLDFCLSPSPPLPSPLFLSFFGRSLVCSSPFSLSLSFYFFIRLASLLHANLDRTIGWFGGNGEKNKTTKGWIYRRYWMRTWEK